VAIVLGNRTIQRADTEDIDQRTAAPVLANEGVVLVLLGVAQTTGDRQPFDGPDDDRTERRLAVGVDRIVAQELQEQRRRAVADIADVLPGEVDRLLVVVIAARVQSTMSPILPLRRSSWLKKRKRRSLKPAPPMSGSGV
jgi:hypothetical protein